MKFLFSLVIFSLATLLCPAQHYQLSAELTGFPEGQLFYLREVANQRDLDSARITGNSFVMKGNFEDNEPRDLWLCTEIDEQFYYCNLMIGNESVRIRGDKSQFPHDVLVTGSSSDSVAAIFRKATKALDKKNDSLVAISMSLPRSKADSIRARQRSLWAEIGRIDSITILLRKDLIRQHLNSYAGMSELYMLRNDFEKTDIEKLHNQLTPQYKKSSYAKQIAAWLAVGDPVREGDQFYDFKAEDPNGSVHQLSEIKGKYILLDFTATWCAPCVQAVRDLRKLTKLYPDKLRIVSFCSDKSRDMWLKGLKRDQPTWLSLWDGKSTYSEPIVKYGVQGYPSFCLIDPSGKIVSMWSGYGALENGTGSVESQVKQLIDRTTR